MRRKPLKVLDFNAFRATISAKESLRIDYAFLGNNPMVGATVACAVAVEVACK